MRKLDFCLFENKDADQLCSNCTADQRFFFRYTDSMITTLVKSKISSFKPFPVTAQAGLCQTWSETPNTDFLAWRLSHYWLVRMKTVCRKAGGQMLELFRFWML